jgi:hypothetical protein
VRILRLLGHPVLLEQHLPRRGLAEHRAFPLDRSAARYVLFLDDDVWLQPHVVAALSEPMRIRVDSPIFADPWDPSPTHAPDLQPLQRMYLPEPARRPNGARVLVAIAFVGFTLTLTAALARDRMRQVTERPS